MKTKLLVFCMGLLLVGGLVNRAHKMPAIPEPSMHDISTVIDAQELTADCLCVQHEHSSCPCVRTVEGKRVCANPQACHNKACSCSGKKSL